MRAVATPMPGRVALSGLILCLAFDEGVAARALGAAPLVRLGELSSSVYLLHVPVWFGLEGALQLCAEPVATWLLPDAGATIAVTVSPLGSALVVAYLGLVPVVAAWTHRRVEAPAERRR